MNLLKQIRFILTVDCRNASQLLSDRSERDLARYERIALRFHLFICGPCRKYSRFLFILRDILLGAQSIDDLDLASLPPEAKERIQSAIIDDPS